MAAETKTGQRPLRTAVLFDPVKLGGLTLCNRLAVAPMTRISADVDGHATPQMAGYYGAFAEGGFGLIVSEGIYTDTAWSQGYLFQPGLADDRQRDAWGQVLDRVHDAGGRIFAQLMHAGALSQGNRFRSDTRGPSALRPKGQQLAFYRGCGEDPLPVAMTEPEVAEAIEGFAAAARRAREAGFDGVEIHGANGYLLDQFLSEGVNVRADRYGGSVRSRLGFYDGFFGPGAGSFYALALVTLLGMGLTRATAHTKALNFARNIVSVIVFALGGTFSGPSA